MRAVFVQVLRLVRIKFVSRRDFTWLTRKRRKTRIRIFQNRDFDLASVDRCLKIFDMDFDPTSIQPKKTVDRVHLWLPKGAGTRTALEILRETGEPMTSQELAACILQRFNRPIEERALLRIVRTIHANFCRRKDGVITFDRSERPGKWRLVG